MQPQLRRRFDFLRAMRTGTLEPAIRESLSREEENGSRALIYTRLFFCVAFIVGGLTASQNARDSIVNLFFATGYASVVILQWLLLRNNQHRALIRFSYVMVLADHALFAGQLILYYSLSGTGNFNHALKSPYIVLLLIPTLTTLVQFRYTLVFFSLAIFVLTILGMYGFAILSGVPRAQNWHQYILGEAIILPAWLGLWLLVGLGAGALVAYAIFRSIRMVAQIGRGEGQKKQLARYFSPTVVDEIVTGDVAVESLAAGHRHKIAVLFADIRSFTALSEHLAPDEVAAMLTELRQLQMKAVFDNAGMVDKFVGDAVMAVFGAPRSVGSYAADVTNAVRCGLAMHAALKIFNTARSANGQNEIRIGVGIHAGEAFVGNLGGEGQLEYTVIGDVVNTASRIEHLCKKAQADFLISEAVATEIDGGIEHQKIGIVKIRGREQPMGIHKVIH